MERYRIAGLNVDMKVFGKTMLDQSEKYKVENDGSAPDVTINISEEKLMERMQKNGNAFADLNTQEYMSTGAAFYVSLIKFNGLMLHSSAVVLDGKAYLFSAPSGTGKSTHTSRWVSYFGSDRAFIINDDKPAIREMDGQFMVMGTPWSGKTAMNENVSVPAAAVAFIERSETNRIERLTPAQALKHIMWQTVRPTKEENMERLLTTLDSFIRQVPVYKLYCNISDEAVQVAYEAMKEGK